METIVIAGGTGLIGKELSAFWREKGHEVRLLTRGTAQKDQGLFHWDPYNGTLDHAALSGMTVLVNLSGAGIGDKRWTAARKKALFDSRVVTTECLWKHAGNSTTLKQYISASGAVAYGFEDDAKVYREGDPFGEDLLSVITREWEKAADAFGQRCRVSKIRISVVLAREGGALQTMAKPVRMGFGCILGSGRQMMPWICLHDLVRLFDFVLEHALEGACHAAAGNTDNATLTKTIAQVLGKKLWMPAAPEWVIRLLFGEMAVMVLKGLKVDNARIRNAGFRFDFPDLEKALRKTLQ